MQSLISLKKYAKRNNISVLHIVDSQVVDNRSKIKSILINYTPYFPETYENVHQNMNLNRLTWKYTLLRASEQWIKMIPLLVTSLLVRCMRCICRTSCWWIRCNLLYSKSLPTLLLFLVMLLLCRHNRNRCYMTASTQSGGKSQSKSIKSNLDLRENYLISAWFCYKKAMDAFSPTV